MTIAINRKEDFCRPWYLPAQKLLPASLANKTILDLGGGAGEFSRILRDRGAIVTFVDYAEDAVEKASLLGFSSFRVDLNEPLNMLGDNQFDIVIMLEVIEHIAKTDILLSEVSRVLKNEGSLLLTTPNISHVKSRISAVFGHVPKGEGYHFRFFNKYLLYDKLREHRFKVERKYHSTSTFGINYFLSKIKRKPISLRLPSALENLFVRNFVIIAKQIKKLTE